MKQVSKVTHKDPSIEAILNKRPAFIENSYSKNLRPQEQNTANNETANQTLKDTKYNNSDNSLSLSNKSETNFTKEKTDLSLSSIGGNESENEHENEGKSDFFNDGGVSKYENFCYNLGIGPCSIIIKSLPTSTIILSNYGLNSTSLLALTCTLKTNVTVNKLDLSSNEIGPQGVKHLSNLFDENSIITDLNISKNFIGSDGVKYIVEIFKKNRFLREVDISNNDFNDEDGVLIIESLEDHLMTKLNLSHNKFAEKSGVAIGKWLAENGYMLDLNLGWNHIRKNAALSVSKGIWDNNKLLKINLSWNGFGNEGAVALGKALAHNVMLEELDIRSNRISPQGFANFCMCFKENATLKKVYIGKNNINNETLELVLKVLTTIKPLSLKLLDVSEVSLKPSIKNAIETVNEVHPDFKFVYGFLNFGEKKFFNSSEEALAFIQTYCEKNKLNLIDLLSKLNTDSASYITHQTFKVGIKKTGIPITQAQLDALVVHLDKNNTGHIDLNELDEQLTSKPKED